MLKMKGLAKVTVAAAVLAGAAIWGGTSANARGFAIGVGPGGVNFSYSSGGYCDDYGCPDAFWDMPVYYCPVFYHGDWFRGPMYYRQTPRGPQFWVRGGWRYDQWRDGPRPHWACTDRFGPSLGFEYYDRDHRFHMRDEWRDRWSRDHRRPGGPGAGFGGPGAGGPGRADVDRPHNGPDGFLGFGDKHDKHNNSGPNAGNGPGAQPGQNRNMTNKQFGPGAQPNQNQNKSNNQPGADNNRGPGAAQGGKPDQAGKPGKHDKDDKHGKDDRGPGNGPRP
jgi:hypothetical protein